MHRWKDLFKPFQTVYLTFKSNRWHSNCFKFDMSCEYVWHAFFGIARTKEKSLYFSWPDIFPDQIFDLRSDA